MMTTAGVSLAWTSSIVMVSTAVIWPEASSVTWDRHLRGGGGPVSLAEASVLLVDAVHATVGPAEVAPGVVQLLDEVDVTENLAAARLQLLGGFWMSSTREPKTTPSLRPRAHP